MTDKLEQEAFVQFQRAASRLMEDVARLLKPAGLRPTQYNVLRILRGSPDGLPCGEIGNRMITRDPDITRLLDRLEKRTLIERWREQKDRRVVLARITQPGLDLLRRLDDPVRDTHRRQLGHLGRQKLHQLSELLQESRARIG